MKKLGFLVLGLLCGILLPLTVDAEFGDGVYKVEGGHKTLIWSGTTLTVAARDATGYYAWGNNDYRSGGHYWDDYPEGRNSDIDAWGGGDDSAENGYNSGLNPKRQGPCNTGWHVPSRGEWEDLVIARCNLDNECDPEQAKQNYKSYFSFSFPDSSDFKYRMISRFSSSVGINQPEIAYWSSTRTGNSAYGFNNYCYNYEDCMDPTYSTNINSWNGFVRCFKDVPIIPQTYIVSFFSGTQLITSGEIVDGGLRNEAIPSVTKEGYVFVYRYIQGAEDIGFDFSKTAITGNISLYAKRRPEKCTITYDLSGGYWVEDGTTLAKEVQFTTDANGMVGTTNRKTPSKLGNTCNGMKCMFDGWYLENGAKWIGYADSDMTVHAKWLPFEDMEITLSGVTFTIMDRNLGATASGTGCSNTNMDACGYHFQWGNNYGFKSNDSNNSTFPNGEKGNSAQATDREGHVSTYYNGIRRTSYVWNNGAQANDNLWGGSETSNSDVERQGPCPDGYHVPDALEWEAVGTLLNAGSSGYIVRDILNLPFASSRAVGGSISGMGSRATYMSSTLANTYVAYELFLNSSFISWKNSAYMRNRSNAGTVRCFKNSPVKLLTFNYNGGNTTYLDQPTQTIRWRETPTDLSTASDTTRENSIFEGWYTNLSDETTKVATNDIIGNDDIIVLYAKWICESGYVENNSGTGCIELYTIIYELNDGILLGENVTGYTIESEDITLINPTKIGYTFTGWSGTDIEGLSLSVIIPSGSTGDRSYEANWQINQYTITFDTDGGTNIPSITADYGTGITAPANPTKNGYTFKGWDKEIPTTMPAENITIKAKWEKISGGSSGGGGGGGGGGGSSKSDTSKEEQKTDEAPEDQASSGTTVKEPETTTGNKVETQTGNKAEIQTGNVVDTPEQAPENDNPAEDTTTNNQQGQNNTQRGGTYSTEFQEAYEFAHEKGITTMPTIEKANMNGKLTRIAMAKMLSQYAMNVLGQKPDETINNKFNDVTDKQNSDYDDGVTLAYQLGIMGQNMPGNNFRPNDEVTRGEFVTALSRMLYNTSDGEYKSTPKYYIRHMEKMKEEGIVTKDDPAMKELRGYVMIMLMRSAK